MNENNHERWMARCLELAQAARENGNTAVGSLVVYQGAVIAEAQEETPAGPDPFAHSELLAVRHAMSCTESPQRRDATLYTTAEPCFLCSYAIRQANIGHVVIGSKTPGIGGASSRYPILVADDIPEWPIPPKVTWGVLSESCDGLRKKG